MLGGYRLLTRQLDPALCSLVASCFGSRLGRKEALAIRRIIVLFISVVERECWSGGAGHCEAMKAKQRCVVCIQSLDSALSSRMQSHKVRLFWRSCDVSRMIRPARYG